MISFYKLALIYLISIFILSGKSYSQEMEPRNYSSIPKGLNALTLTYAYSTGDIVADATSPIKDLDLSSNTMALGYVRSFGLLGKLTKVQLSLPFVLLNGTAKFNGKDTSGTRNGFGDSKIKIVMNIVGTPALDPKEFMKFKEKFVFGTSLVISVPTGLYYDDKAINLGSNRWGFKPEIGASYNSGPFYFELFTGVWLFTKNNSFLKTNTVQQDPVLSVQGHISYYFPSKIWIALNSVYVNGGQTKINDTYKEDFQKNFRTGLTLSVPLSMHNSVRADFSKGVATRAGGDFTIYSLTYQYLWF